MAARKSCDDMEGMASSCSSSDSEDELHQGQDKPENILGASDYATIEGERSAGVLATCQFRVLLLVQSTEPSKLSQPADKEKSVKDDYVLAVSTSSPVVSSGKSVEGVLTPSPTSCVGASGLNVGAPTADKKPQKAESTLMQAEGTQALDTRHTRQHALVILKQKSRKVPWLNCNERQELEWDVCEPDVVDLRRTRLQREGRMCVSCHWKEYEVSLHPCKCKGICLECFLDPEFCLGEPKLCPLCHQICDGVILRPHARAELYRRS